MDNPDRAINQHAQGQHGLVTRAALLGAGVADRSIAWRVMQGLLIPVHPGVYRHAATPLTGRARLLAAVLGAGAGAVASHRSAAWLDGLCDVPRARPEITSPRSDLPRLAGVIAHRTKQLDRADVTEVDGIPTTTVPRTLLDLGAVVPFEVVEAAAQDAIIRNLTSAPHLVALLERVGRRGRNGTAALRAVVAQSLPDDKLQSELERRLHALVRQSHLPAPVLQHPVGKYLLDMAWPSAMVALEAEGRRWHATKSAFESWLVRRRELRAAGWDVHSFGWSDVVERPTDCITYLNEMSATVLCRPLTRAG